MLCAKTAGRRTAGKGSLVQRSHKGRTTFGQKSVNPIRVAGSTPHWFDFGRFCLAWMGPGFARGAQVPAPLSAASSADTRNSHKEIVMIATREIQETIGRITDGVMASLPNPDRLDANSAGSSRALRRYSKELHLLDDRRVAQSRRPRARDRQNLVRKFAAHIPRVETVRDAARAVPTSVGALPLTSSSPASAVLVGRPPAWDYRHDGVSSADSTVITAYLESLAPADRRPC